MKNWILARLKEGSTKWGLFGIAILGAAFFSSDQIGEISHRLTEITALLATARLILTQEKSD